jgi:hypothetical protein
MAILLHCVNRFLCGAQKYYSARIRMPKQLYKKLSVLGLSNESQSVTLTSKHAKQASGGNTPQSGRQIVEVGNDANRRAMHPDSDRFCGDSAGGCQWARCGCGTVFGDCNGYA